MPNLEPKVPKMVAKVAQKETGGLHSEPRRTQKQRQTNGTLGCKIYSLVSAMCLPPVGGLYGIIKEPLGFHFVRSGAHIEALNWCSGEL